MDKNVIINHRQTYLNRGKKILKISPDSMTNPTKVIFEFEKGEPEELDINLPLNEFMEVWKFTSSYINAHKTPTESDIL